MLENDEDEARATRRIVDKETGKTVGLLYVWEDGYEQPLWLDGTREDVALCELTDSPQTKNRLENSGSILGAPRMGQLPISTLMLRFKIT